MRAPKIYVGDHQHAKVVCSAFAEGCNGKLVPATSRLQEGPAAMWGILRGAGDRIKDCELYGHPYFYIDHGYFSRGHYDGYYRVVFCDRHLQGPPQPSDGKRWDALGLEVKPLLPGGDRILYLPVSRHVAAHLGFDAGEFDEAQLALLRSRGREVDISPKGDNPTEFEGFSMVVGYQSNALLEASLAGYRVEEIGRSPASWCGGMTKWSKWREMVFPWLADNQWTLAEMRSGKCWADLMARHGEQMLAA